MSRIGLRRSVLATHAAIEAGPVEYAFMHSARFSILAGTALALILASSITAGAAPQNSIAPAPRDYSTPGSMPKPSATITPSENDIRFRDSMPDAGDNARRFETPTPLAPAAASAPVAHPQHTTAKAQAAPAPTAPVAAAAPEPRFETKAEVKAEAKSQPKLEIKPETKTEARTEPKPESKAASKPAPRPETKTATEFEPKPAVRSAATAPRPTIADTAPVPNAASEAEVADKLRNLIATKQYERFVERKTDRGRSLRSIRKFGTSSRFGPRTAARPNAQRTSSIT
jgi:hypothetical protein